MEGYLKKWINLLYRWQSRYFIIHEGVLIYCLLKDKPKKGQVHLSICSIRQVVSDPLRIVINYGMSEMHLRASSVQEQQKWYETLLISQEKFTSTKSHQLLNYSQKEKPFQMLTGAPSLNLNRIHTTLTKIWQVQALLNEKLSLIRGSQSVQIQSISSDLKDLVTICAQQVDDEYNKLVTISDKLKEKITETNDQNPPDNHDDLEDESPESEYINHTEYASFVEEDEFMSVINESICEPVQKRQSIRLENIGLLSNSRVQGTRQQSMQPQGSQSIQDLLQRIRDKQPIKYRNLIANDAFKDMNLGTEDTREYLPCFKDPNEKLRLFSLIKDMVGKDLTKITFPVTFNEPISMLQSFCENLEYSNILDIANSQTDSCLRMAYVMAFAVSSYSSTINRVKKPFNPLLGETYEFQSPTLRFIAEQISHHPPISAGFGENQNFEFYGDTNLKTQFWGKSIEVTPLSYFFVKLKKNNDFFHYLKAKSALKNLIMGTQYLDNYGPLNFINRTTQDVGQLVLTERGWNGGGAYQIKGTVKDSSGVVKYIIQGQWDSQISAINAQTKQEFKLWMRNPLPKKYDQQYYFTSFTLSLNHINQQLLSGVAPTDSRLRPDQRALENGNIDVAAIEKTRLEQKQRLQKTEGKQQGIEIKPKWFQEEIDPVTNEKVYIYNGIYWADREKQNQSSGLDIF